jgi:hypothetical protein
MSGAFVLVALTVALSACGGSHRAPQVTGAIGTLIATKTVSSSRLILGGSVRCTASATTPVEAGQKLGVTFAFQNNSDHAVRVNTAPWDVRFIFKAADGTRFDTNAFVSPTIPYIAPTKLAASATKTVPGVGSVVRVRWEGPLRITPFCGEAPLPVLRVGVVAPGPPPDRQTAVADVVAASAHLLDSCRPHKAGVPVQGKIYVPSRSALPMAARCSVGIRREGKFLVAQELLRIPGDIQQVRIGQRYERVSLPKHGSQLEAMGWAFVVTRDGATPVVTATADRTRAADHMAAEWAWSGSKWRWAGSSRCGGGLFAGSASAADYPTIESISACR